jgi:hypothetical protein
VLESLLTDPVEQLERLARMRELGQIDESEYAAAKKRVLGTAGQATGPATVAGGAAVSSHPTWTLALAMVTGLLADILFMPWYTVRYGNIGNVTDYTGIWIFPYEPDPLGVPRLLFLTLAGLAVVTGRRGAGLQKTSVWACATLIAASLLATVYDGCLTMKAQDGWTRLLGFYLYFVGSFVTVAYMLWPRARSTESLASPPS